MTSHRCFRSVASILSAGVALLSCSALQAQQNSMFGNSTGMSSLSSPNGTSVMSGASAAFGMSGRSPMAPTVGMNPMGMNGMGMNGMGSAMGMNGQMGASNGQRGFLGTTTQGGMVGANTPAAMQGGQNGNQQGMNRNQQGGRNQARGANRGNTNQQQQQFTNQGQRGNSTRSIRPQLKVAFKSPSPKAETTLKNLNVRFDKLSKREGMEGVNVDVDGGKVTLRGEVDSEDSRKLAAMLVSLEPGVRSVQNDLTVNPPAPGGTE